MKVRSKKKLNLKRIKISKVSNEIKGGSYPPYTEYLYCNNTIRICIP